MTPLKVDAHMSAPNATVVPVTVILADDSEVMRGAISQLLAADQRIRVVGEVSNFVALVAASTALRPNVLLVDIHMAGRDEIPPDFFSAQALDCTVLAISLWNDPETVALAGAIGAVKLLCKSDLPKELIPTILQMPPRNLELNK
jgi:DNA-binding NarL/FixJ family response regulator